MFNEKKKDRPNKNGVLNRFSESSEKFYGKRRPAQTRISFMGIANSLLWKRGVPKDKN